MARSIWTIEQPIDELGKMSKPLVKKYRRELKNLLGNLQVYLDALNAGATPTQIHRGFLHQEPHGVLAIDQRGDGEGLKEFRLYIYPDTDQRKLYLLALGDKNSQKSDIASCTRWVLEFRKQTTNLTSATGKHGNSEEGTEARNEQGKKNGV
jgi:hypothetical protein